jgi:hypothetical protein
MINLVSKLIRRSILILPFALVLSLTGLASAQQASLQFEYVGGHFQSSGAPRFVLFTPNTLRAILTSVTGYNGGGTITGDNLGQVVIRTGTMISGDLQTGGTFMSGGAFVIYTNGTNGLPNGEIFHGTFMGPSRWQLNGFTVDNKPMGYYLLSGHIQGQYQGLQAYGNQFTLTFAVDQPFGGAIGISTGGLQIVVP